MERILDPKHLEAKKFVRRFKDLYQIRFCYHSFCRGAMLAPETFQIFIEE